VAIRVLQRHPGWLISCASAHSRLLSGFLIPKVLMSLQKSLALPVAALAWLGRQGTRALAALVPAPQGVIVASPSRLGNNKRRYRLRLFRL